MTTARAIPVRYLSNLFRTDLLEGDLRLCAITLIPLMSHSEAANHAGHRADPGAETSTATATGCSTNCCASRCPAKPSD
jgi:hypothetical protein